MKTIQNLGFDSRSDVLRTSLQTRFKDLLFISGRAIETIIETYFV
jgi:hypothetical protein